MDLIREALQGNKLAAGRIIKCIEDNEEEGFNAIKHLYPHTGNAFIIGITGPPGAGKSTLIDCLITAFRKLDQKVAVLAIDPSSSITGGALLGDRIRMKRHTLDPGVYIRSVATRGALGGISRATKGALIVLDAMKFDIIFIETAGVGQLDVDISLLAHMTLVLCIPGMGDGLQALKAGTLEIADLFVVNKADRPGADDVVTHLENMMSLKVGRENDRRPGIVTTAALEERGIDDVLSAIAAYRREMRDGNDLMGKTADQEYRYLKAIIKEIAADRLLDCITKTNVFEQFVHQLKERRIDPYSAARAIVEDFLALR
jgi:LAO/AO transport system kinase